MERRSVKARVVGRQPELVQLPLGCSAPTARALLARAVGLPPAGLRIVYAGAAVDDAGLAALPDGATVLCVAAPSRQREHALTEVSGTPDADEDEDAELRHAAAEAEKGAEVWAKRLAAWLRREHRWPDWALLVVLSVRWRHVAAFAAWCAVARTLNGLGAGPPFVVLSGIALICTNTSTRKAGEASAWSVFNDGRSLPGAVDPQLLDDQLRRGQLM